MRPEEHWISCSTDGTFLPDEIHHLEGIQIEYHLGFVVFHNHLDQVAEILNKKGFLFNRF